MCMNFRRQNEHEKLLVNRQMDQLEWMKITNHLQWDYILVTNRILLTSAHNSTCTTQKRWNGRLNGWVDFPILRMLNDRLSIYCTFGEPVRGCFLSLFCVAVTMCFCHGIWFFSSLSFHQICHQKHAENININFHSNQSSRQSVYRQ